MDLHSTKNLPAASENELVFINSMEEMDTQQKRLLQNIYTFIV